MFAGNSLTRLPISKNIPVFVQARDLIVVTNAEIPSGLPPEQCT